MPSVLREHQHEIMAADGSRSLVFGTEDTGYLTLSRPTITGSDFQTADQPRPSEDGRVFGRDYLGGKSMVFEVGVLTDEAPEVVSVGTHRANLDYLDALETFWVDDQWRDDPQAMAVLRSCEGGQTWRCYGRPSRYDEQAGRLTQQGYTPVGMEFRLIDNAWYADTERTVDVHLVSAPEGGFVTPFTFPLSSSMTATSTGTITVGGSRPTWPVIEFRGPVTNPRLTIGVGLYDIVVGLDTHVAEGDVVTVDARPWRRTVTRSSDGAAMAGYLTRGTPTMRRLRMPPGTYVLSLNGVSITGSAVARVRWRDARSRP